MSICARKVANNYTCFHFFREKNLFLNQIDIAYIYSWKKDIMFLLVKVSIFTIHSQQFKGNRGSPGFSFLLSGRNLPKADIIIKSHKPPLLYLKLFFDTRKQKYSQYGPQTCIISIEVETLWKHTMLDPTLDLQHVIPIVRH